MFGPLVGVTYNVWTQGQDKAGVAIAKALGYDGKPKIASSDELDKLQADGAMMTYRGMSKASHNEGYRHGAARIGTGLHGSGVSYVTYVDPKGKFRDNAEAKQATITYGDNIIRTVLDKKAKVVTEDDLEAERAKDHLAIADAYRAGKINAGTFKSIHKIIADNGRYAMLKGYDAITKPEKGYMNILNRTATTAQDKDVQR